MDLANRREVGPSPSLADIPELIFTLHIAQWFSWNWDVVIAHTLPATPISELVLVDLGIYGISDIRAQPTHAIVSLFSAGL